MQNPKGFSLLELIAVTGIVALLAVISIPNFSRMRSIASFESEVEIVFDQLLEVRMNALTGKTCDGNASKSWSFTINTETSVVSCIHDTDPVDINTYEILWGQSPTIELDDEPRTEARIMFLPDTAQALLPDGIDEQRTDAKILLTHSSGIQKTICFNRIVGIPEISDGNNDCTTP